MFVEIGVRDITDNMRVDMAPFGQSTTFSFINVVSLLQESPHVLGEILSASSSSWKRVSYGLHIQSPCILWAGSRMLSAICSGANTLAR
jgi:hypothetical protein